VSVFYGTTTEKALQEKPLLPEDDHSGSEHLKGALGQGLFCIDINLKN